ncbi:MAG: hypothetical protein HYV27_16000 [Candidatus Hydrogenedentes bacterium]|nr:hypothetical protein [Candidatus Hydrogenedentota bacterium]
MSVRVCVVLVLVTFFQNRVHGLEFRVSLEPEEIHASSPVELKIEVQREATENDVRDVSLQVEWIQIALEDEGGGVVAVSVPATWHCPSEFNDILSFPLSETGVATQFVPLSRWCSTAIPPGSYVLRVMIQKYSVFNTDSIIGRARDSDQPVERRLPLRVLETKDAAVRGVYDGCLRKAINSAVPGVQTSDVVDQGIRAVNCIMYAREAIALPYQLRLFNQEIPYQRPLLNVCHFIDLMLRFVASDRVEVAKGLVDLLDSKAIREEPGGAYLPDYIVWTLHEMHARGNPEVMRVTEDVVARYPKPRDPRPGPDG